METSERGQRPHDDEADFYVVELKSDRRQTRYAVCERIVTVGDDDGDLPYEAIEAFLKRHPLRAAPIPTDKRGGGPRFTASALRAQSTNAPSISINIHNNVDGDRDHDHDR